MNQQPIEKIREIGHGAYGTVYLTRGADGTFFAHKVCRRPESGDASGYEREKRGVALFSRIPPFDGLIRIRDFRETADGGEFSVSMDLADPEVPGDAPDSPAYRPKTLASVLSAETALPLRDCLRLGVRLSAVLVHLQRHHLAHRDIKPENILFIHGRPVLADVGLVADMRGAASVVGTPGYVPPENHGTPQGDVFSLGKTLYRASTGREPDEPGFAPCAEADVDAPFFWKWMSVIEKACSPYASRRYRSAKAFHKELARLKRQSDFLRLRFLRGVLRVAAVLLFGWLGMQTFLLRGAIQTGGLHGERYRIKWPWPYRIVQPLFLRKEPSSLERLMLDVRDQVDSARRSVAPGQDKAGKEPEEESAPESSGKAADAVKTVTDSATDAGKKVNASVEDAIRSIQELTRSLNSR